MNIHAIRPYFLLALLIGTGILAFFVFRPFLYALILATVFAVVFQGLHKRVLILVRHHQVIDALCSAAGIIASILVPVAFLGWQIFYEAEQLYGSFIQTNQTTIFAALKKSTEHIGWLTPVLDQLSSNVDQYIQQSLTWLVQNTGAVFSNLAKLAASCFIFIVALYYLLKDGKKIKDALVILSPLSHENDAVIFQRLDMAVNSVIKGNLIIAVIQGILAGIGFFVFGIPNIARWGTATPVAALIPGVGTAIIIAPAVIFLFINANTVAAIGLLAWGVVIVGLIDNILRPKLIGQGTKLHPLVAFLSVFGGIIFFGPMGFLLGPLTLSLFFAVLHIYLSKPLEHSLEADGF